MLFTRYNEAGTMIKVARDGLKAVEKAGFTYEESPVAPVAEVVVEEAPKGVAPVAEVVVEEAPKAVPAPKKRGRKPKTAPVQVEAEKDIVL